MYLLRNSIVGGLALAALLLVGGRVAMAQAPDSAQINKVFSQAQTNAALLSNDAGILESYTRTSVGWETHARQLEVIRGHVNALIGNINKLSAMKDEGSPWQQDAIDRVTPLMQSMADHLTATIEHLQSNQNRIQMQPYRDFARGNQVLADKTLAVIRDYVSYGKARATADDLERKLGTPEQMSE
jgi:hypothetical protein